MITFAVTAKFNKEVTVIFMDPDQLKAGKASHVPAELKETIQKLVKAKQFEAKNEEIYPVILKNNLYLLAGVGKRSDLTLTSLRITARKALMSSYLSKLAEIEIIPHDGDDNVIRALIEAIEIGTYSFKKYKTKDKSDAAPDDKHYYLIAKAKNEYDEYVQICAGVNLTRDLINDNADVVTSDYLEKTIRDLINGQKNISMEVLNRKEIEAKGLGLLLAVNQGSNKEPKLIIVKYQGAPSTKDVTAIVGKGITFDTGGLNLKPSGSMETMRTDMSGAAAVVGILRNTIELGIKKNLLFVLTVAENAIGPGAFKPGDVFRSYSGKTVEIGNTDAEGRLVLADAFSYIIKNYKPSRIIDMATLTGACVVALGHDYAGLMTTDEKMSREIVHASNETDDRVWRLPLYKELKDAVKSQIADIRNLGFPKGAGGTITAAEFLHQFIGDTPWAHLDIAGVAFVDGTGRWYYGHGATGFGVRLLTHYLHHS